MKAGDPGVPAAPKSATESRDSVASRIRERMGDCSPAERKVARTILASYPVAGLETVAGLAEYADVSGATVVRFVTRLGYSGFPDFQRALRDELEQRSASPSDLYARTSRDRSRVTPGDYSPIAEPTVEDLRATFGGMSHHDFETAVSALANLKNRVWVVGGRYSGFLGEYLAASLEQLRPGVQMVPNMASLRAATMVGFDSKDVLVAFDFRRYEPATRNLVQHAKARKATVVLVTDTWVSPCVSEADAVLTSVSSERGPFDSVVPVMAIIEALFEATLTRIGDSARDRMERVERAVQELDLL